MLMSAEVRDAAGSLDSAQVGRRWQAIDPLLPVPAGRPPGDQPRGCGARLIVAGADGQPVAAGTCVHREASAESLDLTWGAARTFHLLARLAGPDTANALDELLSQWRDHLASVPEAEGDDAAAIVTWPSRDIDGAAILLRHGLAPLSVIAARTTSHHPAAPAEGPPRPTEALAGRADDSHLAGRPDGSHLAGRPDGSHLAGRADDSPPRIDAAEGGDQATGTSQQDLRIRRAGPADIDAVVRLGLEVIRFDAHFGSVTERPGTADALRREAAGLLAVPGTWTWLAERDGAAIGMLLRRAAGVRGLDRTDGAPVPRCLPAADGRRSRRTRQWRRHCAGGAAAPRDQGDRRGRHAAALCAAQSAVRAVLEPAGLPAALDGMGGPAGPHYPLTWSAAAPRISASDYWRRRGASNTGSPYCWISKPTLPALEATWAAAVPPASAVPTRSWLPGRQGGLGCPAVRARSWLPAAPDAVMAAP
jgi:hypothetical protein